MSYKRFHFKIDSKLLREINSAATYFCTSTSGYINYVFRRMMTYIDSVDMGENLDFIRDDSKGFSKDLIIPLEGELYNKLKYLHFRFQSFSMADILRKILRMYVVTMKKDVPEIVDDIRIKLRGMKTLFVEFQTHMLLKKNKVTRIISLNTASQILNITAYP